MAASTVSVEDHRARILAAVTPLVRSEVVPLADAIGRILAEDVTARLSVPPFDHAAMDGFAVRAVDVAAAAEDAPVDLPVVGVIAAGDEVLPLPQGAAIRIMTGAPLPPGADLVIPFEWTTGADPVRILRPAAAGRHLRNEGEDVAAGEVALPADTRLGPTQIGLLTSVGAQEVAVQPRPRLAVISTGAELVGGQIPDSNTATLVAAGRSTGAEVTAFGPVRDDLAAFRAQLQKAAEVSDIVVTTGGVSAGDHDVVKAALRDLEGFWFGPVAMKPGRPQGYGVLGTADGRRVLVITLPGTPVAAYASFLLYAVPALHVLAGRTVARETAVLAAPVQAADRTVLLPGIHDHHGRIAPLPGHAGHSQRLLAVADALLVVPPTARLVPEGTTVEVLPLHPEEDRHGR
ncbi:MAG: molybdopterin molybdotransferase MoeA [Propionibacteriales bacterium]|nr:molybdopterin molybdotransferase MoeA [Propionibacteriales bacterium]